MRRTAALCAVFCSFAVGPGLFGAVAPISVMALGVTLALALVLTPASSVAPARNAATMLLIAAFCAVLAVALMQLVVFHGAATLAGDGKHLPGTINSAQTERAIGPIIVNLLALLVGLRLASTPERAWVVLGGIAVAVLGWTMLTTLQFLVDPTSLLWMSKRAYLDSLTGPFVNRNTAAMFFGFGLLCLIGACRDAVIDLVRRPYAAYQKRRSSRARQAVVLVAVAFLLVALMLTRSRAGIILSLIGVAGFVVTISFRSELKTFKSRAPGLFWTMMAIGTLGVLTALLMVVDVVGQRGAGDGGRLSIYLAGLSVVSQQPLWGIGLGAFADIFPTVRPQDLSSWGVWDKAHNTVLELMIEIGLPAGILVIVAALAVLRELVRGSVVRQRHAALPALGAFASLMFGLHSLIDFPLQIPGLAVMFFTALGVCLSQSRPATITKPMARTVPSETAVAA